MCIRNRKTLYYLSIMFFTYFSACDIYNGGDCPDTEFPHDTDNQVTIKQGIWGNIWFWDGNFQPVCPSGKVLPVEREIYVHRGTPIDSVEHNESGPFFTKINTELITVIRSNSTGFFQMALDTGAYSLFIKEDSLFYAGRADKNFLQPGYVTQNSVSKVQIDITYNAAY